MKIAIVGAGNIGLYIGARLIEAGGNVTFLGRERMHEHLRHHGLVINSYQGLAVSIPSGHYDYHQHISQLPKVDIILLTTKTTQTEEVLKEIKASANTHTKILNLQNGVGNDEMFQHLGLKDALIEGIVMFNVVINEKNEFLQSTNGPVIVDKKIDRELRDLFSKARIEFKATNNVKGYKWSKLLLNLNNSVNALAGIPIRAELEQIDYRRVLAELMRESLLVIEALGIKLEKLTPIHARFVPQVLTLPNFLFKKIAKKMVNIDPQAKASMLIDLERNAPTEIDYINGKIVKNAEALGLKVPFNTKIVHLIKEAELKKQGSPMISGPDLLKNLK